MSQKRGVRDRMAHATRIKTVSGNRKEAKRRQPLDEALLFRAIQRRYASANADNNNTNNNTEAKVAILIAAIKVPDDEKVTKATVGNDAKMVAPLAPTKQLYDIGYDEINGPRKPTKPMRAKKTPTEKTPMSPERRVITPSVFEGGYSPPPYHCKRTRYQSCDCWHCAMY